MIFDKTLAGYTICGQADVPRNFKNYFSAQKGGGSYNWVQTSLFEREIVCMLPKPKG